MSLLAHRVWVLFGCSVLSAHSVWDVSCSQVLDTGDNYLLA